MRLGYVCGVCLRIDIFEKNRIHSKLLLMCPRTHPSLADSTGRILMGKGPYGCACRNSVALIMTVARLTVKAFYRFVENFLAAVTAVLIDSFFFDVVKAAVLRGGGCQFNPAGLGATTSAVAKRTRTDLIVSFLLDRQDQQAGCSSSKMSSLLRQQRTAGMDCVLTGVQRLRHFPSGAGCSTQAASSGYRERDSHRADPVAEVRDFASGE